MHRKLGRESKQAYGINKNILRQMIGQTTEDLRGLRDCALLNVAYDTMCRRDELTSLLIEDLTLTNGTSKIKLRKSKTDQDQIGRWLSLTDHSKNSIEKWLKKANIKNGKLFRGVKNNQNLNPELNKAQVNKIFKKYAVRINIESKQVSGHSIRIGSAQDLLKSGASIATILQKGRWSKTDTLMQYTKHLLID
jgi:site-specific recombinase XerD